MIRWVATAIVAGAVVSEANGSPFKLSPAPFSLSSSAVENAQSAEGDEYASMENAIFEFLNQCSEANLDVNTCLVKHTLLALGSSSSTDDDDYSSPIGEDDTGHRFLQEDGDCGSPDVTEDDLRIIMDGSKAQCAAMEEEDEVSEDAFEVAVTGIMKMITAESCMRQLCEDPSLYMEIWLQEVAQCAGVQLDGIDQCLLDGVLELMANGDDMDSEANRARRKLEESSSAGCQPPSSVEVSWIVSLMLMEAGSQCSEVSPEAMSSATSDLTTIFVAQHCWSAFGEGDCDDDLNDDWSDDWSDDHYIVEKDHNDNSGGGLDAFGIAVKYVEKCADLELNMTSCLASTTIDLMNGGGTMPGASGSGRRFLQTSNDNDEQCVAPEFEEPMLRALVEGSKMHCVGEGHDVSAQEFEDTVNDFLDFFGAQSCWIQLCEEAKNPSEEFLVIMFEEIAQCSGAVLDFNPCIVDSIFEMIFSEDDSDDDDDDDDDYFPTTIPTSSFEPVPTPTPADDDIFLNGFRRNARRKLEHVMGNPSEEGSADFSEPCDGQANEAEISFAVGFMLLGVQEQCPETLSSEEISYAQSQLVKLFGAQKCWGVSSDCGDHHGGEGPHDQGMDSSYLDFTKESTIWMLGQCAEVDDVSCVFSRSIEVMHGMTHYGWTHDGNPQHFFDNALQSSICVPPTVGEDDIEQIVHHSKDYCQTNDEDHGQTIQDLKNLIAKPDCWHAMCEPEVKEIIVEEW